MYIFNLCPFPIKGVAQFYSWMSIGALRNFPHDEICLLGAAQQMHDPSTIKHDEWVYRLAGTAPKVDNWSKIKKLIVPDDMLARIVDESHDPASLLRDVIVDGFREYRDWLYARFRECETPKAVITFVNDASLEDVCRQIGIPVIHMESGFIRGSTWRMSTFQFDFRGVNGNTEAATRFEQSRHEVYRRYTPKEIGEALIRSENLIYFNTPLGEYKYEFGIPLQVEDDSNLIAFSGRVKTNLDTVYLARKIFPPNMLLARNHPLALMPMVQHPNLAHIDNSASSWEFISKCKRILTINSSVAFEAMLMGRATYVLGDSALRSCAYTSVDRHLRDELRRIPYAEEFLDFITFNYLMPGRLWLDKSYIDFRLAKPTEREIRNWHISTINEQLGTSFSVD